MFNKKYITRLLVAEYVNLDGKIILKPLYAYDEPWIINGEKSFFPRSLLIKHNNKFVEIKKTLNLHKFTNRAYFLHVPV